MRTMQTWVVGLAMSVAALGASAATELRHWPSEAAAQIDNMIAANANKGAYAVFDMDNTSYQFDIEEALLPYLEMKGVLTRETMDPSLKLIPFKDSDGFKESLNSYYYRLCEIDDLVCYPWVAQIFSGLTLRELKGYVDEVMAYHKPVPISYYDGDKVVHGLNRRCLRLFLEKMFRCLRALGDGHAGVENEAGIFVDVVLAQGAPVAFLPRNRPRRESRPGKKRDALVAEIDEVLRHPKRRLVAE